MKAMLIIQILKIVWPFASEELKELAEGTDTKWDDRALMFFDMLLGRADPAAVSDKDALVGYLLELLLDIAPDLITDQDKLTAALSGIQDSSNGADIA